MSDRFRPAALLSIPRYKPQILRSPRRPKLQDSGAQAAQNDNFIGEFEGVRITQQKANFYHTRRPGLFKDVVLRS